MPLVDLQSMKKNPFLKNMLHINRNRSVSITSAHVSQLYWNIENQITSWWKKISSSISIVFIYKHNIVNALYIFLFPMMPNKWQHICIYPREISDNKSTIVIAAHFPKLSRAPVSLLRIYWRMQHDIIKFVRNQISIANILS